MRDEADTAPFGSIPANVFLSNTEERRTRKTLAAPINLGAFRDCLQLQGQLEQLANETVAAVRRSVGK